MKKLIVLSVVLALVAGSVFAVDVTGTVFGHINLIEGNTGKDSDVTTSGGMDRVRLDGSGENDDGTFGGYIRFQMGNTKYLNFNYKYKPGGDPSSVEEPEQKDADFVLVDSANVWWKPIDQFKLIIGNNSDGFWGKEGVTGWGFNQMPYDSGVAFNPGTWFGDYWDSSPYVGGLYMCSRYVFFEGVVARATMLEITPSDMIGINIAIPFAANKITGENEFGQATIQTAADVFKSVTAQLDVKLDFGNIAVTYAGGGRSVSGAFAGGAIFAYFGGTFGDLGLDVGFSYRMTDEDLLDAKHPVGLGLGLKYATDSFGIKFKTTVAMAGDDKNTYINAAILPYFTLSDSLSAFINAGLGMTMDDAADETYVGWYFNPYLRVGAEWGPTFYAGIQVSSNGKENAAGDKIINWAVPISLMISF